MACGVRSRGESTSPAGEHRPPKPEVGGSSPPRDANAAAARSDEHPGPNGKGAGSIPACGSICRGSSIGRAAGFYPDGWRFEPSLRRHPSHPSHPSHQPLRSHVHPHPHPPRRRSRRLRSPPVPCRLVPAPGPAPRASLWRQAPLTPHTQVVPTDDLAYRPGLISRRNRSGRDRRPSGRAGHLRGLRPVAAGPRSPRPAAHAGSNPAARTTCCRSSTGGAAHSYRAGCTASGTSADCARPQATQVACYRPSADAVLGSDPADSTTPTQEAVWHIASTLTTNPAFQPMRKRRLGFPSETHVKRGDRVVRGSKRTDREARAR